MPVIYITGLGDNNPKNQIFLVNLWKIHRVKPVFFRVGWEDDEAFSTKLNRLSDLVDKLYTSYGKVGLFATSAGVSMAFHGYASRPDKILGVVSICGKIGRPEYVLDRVKQKNPSFAESMSRLPETLSVLTPKIRKSIICVVPLADKIVDTQDQSLAHAQLRRAFSFGHVSTIALQISLFSGKNLRFLKKLQQKL